MGFLIIFHTAKVEPTGELFDYFFTTNCDLGGWISISHRVVKKACLLRAKERPDPDIPTTSLMFSKGSKDSDDWKERFVFSRPKAYNSSQEVWTVCNRWTLDTKHKHPNIEAIKEPASRIIRP